MVLALLVSAGYVAWLDVSLRSQFEGRRWSVPARLYARPAELYTGMRLTADALETELRAAGYQPSAAIDRAATYARRGNDIRLHTRRFQFWDAEQPARRDPAADLCAGAVEADLGMDRVREVDGRGPGRERLHLALWSENKDLALEEVHAEELHEVLRIPRILLPLQHLPEPT